VQPAEDHVDAAARQALERFAERAHGDEIE
jgi:hypothetical protein